MNEFNEKKRMEYKWIEGSSLNICVEKEETTVILVQGRTTSLDGIYIVKVHSLFTCTTLHWTTRL